MKTFIAGLLLIFVLTTWCFAQTNCCPYIGPIEIIPANPTTGDTVRVVTVTTTLTYGHKISYTSSMSGNHVQLDGCFSESWAQALRTYRDTTTLGQLQPGQYSIHYTATLAQNDTVCIPIQINSVDTSYQVVVLDSQMEPESDAFDVFPNPAKDFITVKQVSSLAPMAIQIIDAWGKVCYQSTVADETKIDMRSFAKGVYWVVMRNDDRRSVIAISKD